MHEILENLRPGCLVLDVGCQTGSFAPECTAATVIRLDYARASGSVLPGFVQGDARRLPFRDRTFTAVISNHSLEHFDDADAALREIGRVLQVDGALFVAVPDASTVTDKLYRWLAKGGGHVNAFTSAADLVSLIERATGFPHAGTRTLCSSLSFLNSRNATRPRPRRLMLLGGGSEWSLFLYSWLSRRLDRGFGTRTSIYGWALYFGRIASAIDTETWKNVCIRCGAGIPLAHVRTLGKVYRCSHCGAMNPLAI